MIRLFALASFVYQSAAAIVLIFVLSHILAPAEYTTFSLALASSQFLCVLMFEWLQLAGVRFLAAAHGEEAARLRSSLIAAALLSATLLIGAGSAASIAGPLPLQVVGLGLTLAVLQGFADLNLMMIRVSDRLAAAAALLTLRATLLLAAPVAGALMFGTTTATLAGGVLGQTATLVVGWLAYRPPLQKVTFHVLLSTWRHFARYGIPAAGASVIHLSVPVMMRFIVISGLAAAGPAATAGFSMAVDLLQRPFAVIIAAIHTISYPDVVAQFEHRTKQESRDAIGRFYDFILCTTIVMLGGLIGFLPDAGRLFIPADVLTSFLSYGAATAVFYFFHVHLQSTLAVIPHLTTSSVRLVVIAACQLALVSLFTTLAVARSLSPASVVTSATIATGVVTILGSGPAIRNRATPRWSVVAGATVAAMVIGASEMLPSESPVWLAAKIAIAAVAVALVAWHGNFLSATGGTDLQRRSRDKS